MGGPRSKATEEDLRTAWESDEPFKAVAARIGMSPNTLRERWKTLYGDEAFVERGRRLQATAAATTAREISVTRVYKDVKVPCSVCGVLVTLKSNQVSQMSQHGASFVCEECSGDRDCPVCGLRVDGERGLAQHFRHRAEAGDERHARYEQGREDARFSGLTEGRDYVACRMLGCSYRADTLARHLKAVHGITAEEYRGRYPGALIRSETLTEKRRVTLTEARQGEGYTGEKVVTCPSCDTTYSVSKFVVPGTHDLRCAVCRTIEEIAEAEAKWEGKSEPGDYVTCRACGHRAANLNSHIMSVHPNLVGRYTERHPGALINALSSGIRDKSWCKIKLTRSDLSPFMDEQGRVEVAKAAAGLGCSGLTVLLRCREQGLPTRNRLAFQKRVLDSIADILGVSYVWEWSHTEIVNPKTGHRLYYDGYFPSHQVLVEVQGEQHYKYIPYWHQSEEAFEERKTLDALKVQWAQDRGYKVLVIKYDEPFTDISYLTGRLVEMGVLSPARVVLPGKDPILDLFG
jgi:hypothetical protein